MKNLYPENKLSGIPVHVSPAQAEITGFFRDVLESGASLRVKVTGKSMAPFLEGGEVVTIKKVPSSELHRGDLIFFESPGSLPILHRLIRIRRNGKAPSIFQAKGDALKLFDRPIRFDEVMGKVCVIERVYRENGVRHINMEDPLQRNVNFIRSLINNLKAEWYHVLLRSRRSVLIGLQSLLHLRTALSGRSPSIR